jgi:hypothetical protein
LPRQVLRILQKGDKKKRFETSQFSDDETSLVSSLALPDEKHHHHHTKPLKDRLDPPFSIHTKRLLELVPTLKKAIFWDHKYVEKLSPVKKNSVPFFDEMSEHDEAHHEEEEEEAEEPFLALLSPTPPTKSESKEVNKTTTSSVEEIIQSNNWLKKYEKILTEDLLDDSAGQINGSKSKSPTTRLPDIFPPLSSISRQQPSESFPSHSSHLKSNHVSLVAGGLKPFIKKRIDPLHSSGHKRIITSSASQPVLLNKDKRYRKTNLSLTKL